MRLALVGVLAGVLLAQAGGETEMLERLRSGTPAERREAAGRLGEVGTGAATGALAGSLRDPDPEVRERAQAALWAIWLRSGNAETDRLLHMGILLVERGRYDDAVAAFSDVIQRDPAFAEGWNKRATVYYLMGDFDLSLADCEEVIRRNPIHFGALSGFGLNYLGKGDLERAAEYFERALKVNPNLESIAAALAELRETLKQRRRQAI
jgi:tetratricopeptide (TPR) repeat protein